MKKALTQCALKMQLDVYQKQNKCAIGAIKVSHISSKKMLATVYIDLSFSAGISSVLFLVRLKGSPLI